MFRKFCLILLAAGLVSAEPPYTLQLHSERLALKPGLERFAARVDKDGDHFLSDEELHERMKLSGRALEEWKYAFTGTLVPERTIYPNAEQVHQRLLTLAARRPGLAEVVSLGKSHEGRDLWALRLGPRRDKAVVVTGGIHAREWATVEIALEVAEQLCEAPPEAGEVWIVPLINPDGYEYSREHDNTYRKNRRPEAGVDLNRNFADAGRPHLWRSAEDSPESAKDDVGASDRPDSELYRGPSGNSEPETQALVRLELQQAPVVAVLDNHSFGNMLLRPASSDPKRYESVARAMNEAAGQAYKFESADELYKMTGNSMELHEANGILSVTLESGHSFQPPREELTKLLAYAVPANLAFVRCALSLPPLARVHSPAGQP